MNRNVIYVHRYTLKTRQRLNSNTSHLQYEGALLRIDSSEGSGFANIHPWPSLGDPTLDECLNNLTGSSLGQQALLCADLDRKARTNSESLFANLTIPSSHRTLPHFDPQMIEEALSLCFQTIKVKIGHHWKNESELLLQLFQDFPKINWRLDANHSLTPEDLLHFSKDLTLEQKKQINFIEDPYPATSTSWKDHQQQYGLTFASDQVSRAEEEIQAHWRIIKPAKQDSVSELQKAKALQQKAIITSYMDHPLGQSYAAYQAAKNEIFEDCGLITHQLFEADEFTEALGSESPQFAPAAGSGLGFDDLLESLPWKKLS